MNPNQANQTKYTLVFFVAVMLICVSVSFMTIMAFHKSKEWSHHDEIGGHHWLHSELGLSAEEASEIDAFEQTYRTQREQLLTAFDLRINALAASIRDSDVFSEEINHKIHELHDVHGDLQRLSIEHYYQMLSVLPESKKEKLRALAIEALSTPD